MFLNKLWSLILKKSDNSTFNIADIIGPYSKTHHSSVSIASNGNDAVVLGKKTTTLTIQAKPGTTFTTKFWSSVDGTSYAPIPGVRLIDFIMATSTTASNVSANNLAGDLYEEQWSFSVDGIMKFRAELDAISGVAPEVTQISNSII